MSLTAAEISTIPHPSTPEETGSVAAKPVKGGGWALLWSPLPQESLKALSANVYGVGGLTDVNEGYLIERLHQSGLEWSERLVGSTYLGSEDREVRGKGYSQRWYLAQVDLELTIDGQVFVGSGAHDNRKIDAAFKGAKTVAFKAACKSAGLTIELFKGGKAMDLIFDEDQQVGAPPPPAPSAATQPRSAPQPAPATPQPPPAPRAASGQRVDPVQWASDNAARGPQQQAPAPGPIPPAASADVIKKDILEALATPLPSEMYWGPVKVRAELTRKSAEEVLSELANRHGESCGQDCVHMQKALAGWPQ